MTDAERQRCLARLRFPPPLERAFQEDYYQRTRTTMRIGYAVIVLVGVVTNGASYLNGTPAARLWATGGYWNLAFLLAFVVLTKQRSLWLWQPACLLGNGWLVGFGFRAQALACDGDPHLVTVAARLHTFLPSILIGMIGAVVLMRVQWRWATLILVDNFLIGFRTALSVFHAPVTDVAAVFDSPGLQAIIFLSLAAYLQEWLSRSAFLANHLLDIERAKSEKLLVNVLPAPIADRLKAQPGTIADTCPALSVLFADIVGFTPLSARLSPTATVELLNAVFSRFDELARQHGIEKIKTVGDAYMAVSGLPTPRSDHLEALARMALEMQRAMAEFSQFGHGPIRLRIGLHTGLAVAGVIGTTKFAYDLWGETVNTASRLEEHGVPEKIQVSAAVAEKLEGQFRCTYRGRVELKGCGPVETYFLEEERGAGQAHFMAPAPAGERPVHPAEGADQRSIQTERAHS